jgi:hypothetical protein
VAERFRGHAGNADVVRQELEREKGIRLTLRTWGSEFHGRIDRPIADDVGGGFGARGSRGSERPICPEENRGTIAASFSFPLTPAEVG